MCVRMVVVVTAGSHRMTSPRILCSGGRLFVDLVQDLCTREAAYIEEC